MSKRRRRWRGGPAGEECLEWKQPIITKANYQRRGSGWREYGPESGNGSNAGRTIPALDHKEMKKKVRKIKN